MIITEMTAASRFVRTSTAAHRAMRNDAARLAAVLQDLEVCNRASSARLTGAFHQCVALIHHHQRTEEDLVFPLVGHHVASFSSSVESLEEDHVDLDAAGARIVSRLRLLTCGEAGSRWDPRRDRLMQDIERFAAILCAHRDREEDALFPAVETLGEGQVKHLLASVTRGRGAVARVVPWLIANAEGPDRRELRASLPGPLILMHDLAWGRRFARRMTPLYAPDGRT